MVYSVVLSNARKASEFVAIANKFTSPVRIISDKYAINAKSMMGMMTLELGKSLTVEVDDSEAEAFLAEIENFLVK